MIPGAVEDVGREVTDKVIEFGDFCTFCGGMFRWLITAGLRVRNLRNLLATKRSRSAVRSGSRGGGRVHRDGDGD